MIVLDLSRLLSRAGRGTPTGIDRVELAYAEHLLASEPSAGFVALNDLGGLAWLPPRHAQEFVATIAAAWRGGSRAAEQDRRAWRFAQANRMLSLANGERRLFARLRAAGDRPIYLLVSHHHLERPRIFERIKAGAGARFVCLIHDLIPVEYPEYAKPGQAENHMRRIQTAVRFGDALIVNSQVTGEGLRPHLQRAGRSPPMLVAPFGTELRSHGIESAGTPAERPYFAYVSTIEARKNHLLLLNLWRRLAAEFGDASPQLVLIGQRGWEVENVIDMLDRSPSLRGTVIEHNELPDDEMVRLLQGARALLLPSFAEGFGFPVIEALALGVPALCSDIAALRETGGSVPEYLDPLDGPGWRSAILDYAAPASPRREAQLARLGGWRPPLWQDHFARVDRFLAETSRAAPCRDPG